MNTFQKRKQGKKRVSPARDALKALQEVTDSFVTLGLDEIVVDETIQVRVMGIDKENLDGLVSVLENGGEMHDPVVVFKTNKDFLLVDGFHRHKAHQIAGRTEIQAEIKHGSRDEAVEYAEGANLMHGKGLSNKDKKAILFRRLERGHEWVGTSYELIGRELGVNRSTVSRWFNDFKEMTGANARVDRSQVVGADGRTYDTQKVEEANRERVPALSKLSDEKLRKLAAAFADKANDDPYYLKILDELERRQAATQVVDRENATETYDNEDSLEDWTEEEEGALYDGIPDISSDLPIPLTSGAIQMRNTIEGNAGKAWQALNELSVIQSIEQMREFAVGDLQKTSDWLFALAERLADDYEHLLGLVEMLRGFIDEQS